MRIAISFVLLALFSRYALAQSAPDADRYPIKPIRMIVPSAPGSGPDTMARAIGQQLTPILGQPVVIENRGGAGGLIGGEAAAKAPADGHTLIMASAGSHAVKQPRRRRRTATRSSWQARARTR